MKRTAICAAVGTLISDLAAARDWACCLFNGATFDESQLPAVRLLRGNSGLDGQLLAGLKKETLRLEVSLLASGADAVDQADAFEEALRESLQTLAARYDLGINSITLAVSWDPDTLLEPSAAARLAIIINHIS